MNKGDLHNLLSGKNFLSKEKINEVLKEDFHLDTLHLDDFESEALAGWKESGVEQVDMTRVSKKLGFSKSKLNLNLNLNLILAGILTIILLFFIFRPIAKSDKKVATHEAQNNPQLIEQTDLYIAEKFDTLVEERKISNREIQSLQRIQQAQPTIKNTVEEIKPIFIIETLPTKPIFENQKIIPIKLDTKKKIKEINFHSFKLVDYTAIRGKPAISTQQMDLTGTSANAERRDTKSEEVEWRTVDIPYIAYINKTMRYLDKGNLKNALARFDIILASYPDDVNAQFYAGFALFNLNEFEKAQNRFLEVLHNNLANFDEEAMWYLALSYENSYKNEKAMETFRAISNSSSFYAERARKKI